MPIHRGQRLDDYIQRLPHAIPVRANIYQTWPNLAAATLVTPSTTAPSWVQFIAAASAPTTPFTVTHTCLPQVASTQNNALSYAEVGTGASGSEVAVAVYGLTAYNNGFIFGMPLAGLPIIQPGTRVSVRIWGPSNACNVKIITSLLPPTYSAPTSILYTPKFTSYYPGLTAMFATAPANPTSGGAAWTYGSYVQLYDSTVESKPTFICGVSSDNYNGDYGQIAFATGASGSEVVWGEFPYCATDSMNIFLPIPVLVPGSTRHTAKYADYLTASHAVAGAGCYYAKGPIMP